MVSESRLAVFGTSDNVRLNKSNVLFYPIRQQLILSVIQV